MKELSIEQKAKAYDEAIKRAKSAIKECGNNQGRIAMIESIFPELKESEDDRIRKALIRFHKSTIDVDGIKGDDIIAWLEKQSEQKPSNKVEPKFHEGDWITNGDYTWKIVEVKPLDYILQAQDGIIVDDTISHVDEQFHSFTVQDAKDGDVLLFEGYYNSIVLFQGIGINGEGRINYHCKCDLSNYSFGIQGDVACLGTIEKNAEQYHPATKEQRDILFQKMKEAGYEWDSEKKELKIIDWSKHIKYEPNSPSITEQKPAWSEEDDYNLQCCIAKVQFDIDNGRIGRNRQLLTWLKSLKDRYTWKPSDEQMEALRRAAYEPEKNWSEELQSLYCDLKKLKEE